MYIYIYIYIYIHTYIYANLSRNVIVRLSHSGQVTFVAPSADKQTCNYDTECSNHHPIALNHHKALYA